MSKEFEKALRIISKPPEQRQSHEIHQLVPWLRSKAKLFKGLKTDILADIIRNCRVVTKNRDDVVIKQGDVGDCFYITLNGKVTIYILNKDQLEGEEDDGDFSHVIQYTKDGDLDRAKLGNFVTSLGPGAPFGDVALTSGDSIRTASIISDERTDLLVVDRALYNRSMKEVLAKEFLEKTTFIKNNPLFSNWPPKYRKQLAMALYKETFGYESTLTRQGDRTTDMYFILRGQVEIQIDPSLHPQQYPLIFKAARENEVDKLIKKVEKPRQHKEKNNNNNSNNNNNLHAHMLGGSSTTNIKRRDATRCTRLCHLGVNESVGDVELTMDLPSYAQSAMCRETTDVLVLEHKHYERLFLRRHPRTIEAMRDQIGVKLTSRLSMLNSKQEIPFLSFLVKIIESRHKGPPTQEREDEHTVTSAEKDFLNHKGPLIDLHGPGSVFFLIRLRERTKRRMRAKRGERTDRYVASTSQSLPTSILMSAANHNGGLHDIGPAYARPRSARGLPTQARSFRLMQSTTQRGSGAESARIFGAGHRDDLEFPDQENILMSPSSNTAIENAEEQDARLSTLEERVRTWLEQDSPRGKAQVAPLRRLVLEDMEFQPKPGNRVFVRRKDIHATPTMTSSSSSTADQPRDSPRQMPRDSPRQIMQQRESPRAKTMIAGESKMAAYNILLTQ